MLKQCFIPPRFSFGGNKFHYLALKVFSFIRYSAFSFLEDIVIFLDLFQGQYYFTLFMYFKAKAGQVVIVLVLLKIKAGSNFYKFRGILMKIFLSIIMFIFTFFTFALADVCDEIDGNSISSTLELENFSVISKRAVNGLCEVIIKTDNKIIPFYGNKNFLITGEMYQKGTNITAEAMYNVNKQRLVSEIGAIDDCVSFVWKPKKIKTKKILYMFTDPLCPYCNRIGKDIFNLSEKYGFVLKVVIFSVHGEKGREKSVEAICRNLKDSSFDFAAYSKDDWKQAEVLPLYKCQKGYEILEKAETLADSLAIDAVPFFVTSDGDYVSGASREDVEDLFKK